MIKQSVHGGADLPSAPVCMLLAKTNNLTNLPRRHKKARGGLGAGGGARRGGGLGDGGGEGEGLRKF